MKTVYGLIFLLGFCSSFAQGEANNWYFGQNGGINFSTTPPSVLTNGRLNTLEGCTTISDTNGDLLFYTDGSVIYNRNHQQMFNGTGLKGDESSTSSALIVPQPNTPGIYLVFTVDEPHHFNADNDPSSQDGDGINDGLMYSIIDMSLDNGNGAVISGQKNIPLVTYNPSNAIESAYKCSEKITAVKSDDCDSFWVITHFINTFYAFEVDQTGVNTVPVTSRVGVTVPVSGYRRNALGYMKASPEGDKIALAHLGLTTTLGGNGPGKVLIYDFDAASGIISNEIELYNGDAPYGIEFSQSGNRLYTTIGIGDDGIGDGFLSQYNLELPDNQIAGSEIRIPNELGQTTTAFSAGALQLAPDGKIYRALYNFNTGESNFLGVIENPEALGNAVDYKDRGILVNTDGNRGSRIGLPPFIQSIFAKTIDIINRGEPTNLNLNLCEGETYELIYQNTPGATFTWFFNDVPTGNTTNSLEVSATGNYRLEVDLNDGTCPLIGVANVTFFTVPVINSTPSDQEICDDNNDNITTLDLTQFDAQILGSQDPLQFQVRYFRNQSDADTGTNPLPDSFETENNPQTLVARIENTGFIECFDTTDFLITIYDTPTANPVDPIILCDNDEDGNDSNGEVDFDLNSLNNLIYNGQDQSQNTLSYHMSLAEANANTNPIPDPANYTLSSTITIIYARLENNTNTDCFDILEIPVTINELPEAIAGILVQCDEFESTNDGITLFNLQQAIPQITNNEANRGVQFFESLVDAENATNPITAEESYQNTINNQQLFARVTNAQTQCFRITTINLEVSTTSASDAVLALCDDDGLEDGITTFDLTLARSQVLDGINSPNLSILYYESLEDALSETNVLPNTYRNTTPLSQGNDIVYARVEDNANQCFGINQIALFVNPLPDVESEAEAFICLGETTQINSGLLSGEVLSDYDFLWSTGEITEQITVSEPGDYILDLTDLNTGCSRTRTVTVIASGPPTILNIEIEDAQDNNRVTIEVEGLGNYEYAIAFNGNNIRTYQDDPVFTDVPAGFHTVYIRDKNGCLPEVTQDISVVGFPKYFTPNGDSFHETWSVQGVSPEILGNSVIFIYDRFGKLLKQLTPRTSGWDGTYRGQLMPSSEYWFKVELEDGRVVTGSFSLIR